MDHLPISGQQLAEAGEHYVLHRLYLLGLVGGQAPRGMADTDLLVMRPDGSAVATVQVKTRRQRPADGGWHMRAKHEHLVRANLVYVFVCFGGEHPLSYVIPSDTVARLVATRHRAWLAQPGLNGRRRNDGELRRLCPTDPAKLDVPGFPSGWLEDYREHWDLIESART